MKKITRSVLAISIIFSSCSKEPTWARNYSQPVDVSDPVGVGVGASIQWSEGMSDEECIKRVKTHNSYDPSKPIFLSPNLYDLSQNNEGMDVPSPSAEYMAFPHSVNSMANTWSWGYIEEMNQLRADFGDEGMQMFLDKYLQGDSTLGMKLKNF